MRRSDARYASLGVLCTAAVLLTGCGGGGSAETAGASTPPPSGDHAPTISGAPLTSVRVGEAYSFQPSASDSDNDTLTFSATNLPSWASLNAQTGKISGTPQATDVGTFANVKVSVSDGSLSAALGTFSITVSQVATGSVSLSWMPPTTNSDGSSLTNLSGYRVVYGRSADDLSSSVTLTNPSLSSYVIENLSAGTWFFGVKSVNSAQDESAVSNVASKTI